MRRTIQMILLLPLVVIGLVSIPGCTGACNSGFRAGNLEEIRDWPPPVGDFEHALQVSIVGVRATRGYQTGIWSLIPFSSSNASWSWYEATAEVYEEAGLRLTAQGGPSDWHAQTKIDLEFHDEGSMAALFGLVIPILLSTQPLEVTTTISDGRGTVVARIVESETLNT